MEDSTRRRAAAGVHDVSEPLSYLAQCSKPTIRYCRTNSGTKYTVALGVDTLCLHRRTVLFCFWMRIARARFLSDATPCPMVTSKPVSRRTVPDIGSGS